MDAEGERRSAEISRRAFHRTNDVFLLEFFRGEIQRDSVGEKLIDDLLKLPIEIHIAPRKIFSGERGGMLAKLNRFGRAAESFFSARE